MPSATRHAAAPADALGGPASARTTGATPRTPVPSPTGRPPHAPPGSPTPARPGTPRARSCPPLARRAPLERGFHPHAQPPPAGRAWHTRRGGRSGPSRSPPRKITGHTHGTNAIPRFGQIGINSKRVHNHSYATPPPLAMEGVSEGRLCRTSGGSRLG